MNEMNDETQKTKITKAEAGRLGGKISRGGGRLRKYASDQERRSARVRQQQEYLRRLSAVPNLSSRTQTKPTALAVIPPKEVAIGKLKELFLLALKESGGNVTRAVDASGLARRTAYDHLARDPDFAAGWREAVEIGHDRITECLHTIALSGHDTIALIYAHKQGAAQKKWRERILDMGRIALRTLHEQSGPLNLSPEQVAGLQENMLTGFAKVPLI